MAVTSGLHRRGGQRSPRFRQSSRSDRSHKRKPRPLDFSGHRGSFAAALVDMLPHAGRRYTCASPCLRCPRVVWSVPASQPRRGAVQKRRRRTRRRPVQDDPNQGPKAEARRRCSARPKANSFFVRSWVMR